MARRPLWTSRGGRCSTGRLDAFRAASRIAEIVVAAPPGQHEPVTRQGVVAVAGGEHRSESVANALALCGGEIVVVHDAARPLVAPGLIDAMVEELAAEEDAAGVIAATPVTDTIKQADEEGRVERTLDRIRPLGGSDAAGLPGGCAAGSPRRPRLAPAASDDAMLVERRGGRVVIHPTSPDNIKVTTPFDLRVAELLLRERRVTRAGSRPPARAEPSSNTPRDRPSACGSATAAARLGSPDRAGRGKASHGQNGPDRRRARRGVRGHRHQPPLHGPDRLQPERSAPDPHLAPERLRLRLARLLGGDGRGHLQVRRPGDGRRQRRGGRDHGADLPDPPDPSRRPGPHQVHARRPRSLWCCPVLRGQHDHAGDLGALGSRGNPDDLVVDGATGSSRSRS